MTDTHNKSTRLAYLDTIDGNYFHLIQHLRDLLRAFILLYLRFLDARLSQKRLRLIVLYLHFAITKKMSSLRIIAIYSLV